MKSLLFLVVIVALAGGAWFLFSDKALAPTIESGAASNAMPVPGMQPEGGEMVVGGDSTMGDEQAVVVEVVARPFAYTPAEIRVKQGQTVTINFSNTQGTHDWVLDEFNARTPVLQAGQKASVTFVADKKGSFEYYCSVGDHRARGMVGRLIVE